ncbi:lytic transglycosylase domain-containing protein [Actinocorallia populi]|uniref:lytic transglycosylase domain-containing protein n=1 Tax=Actinocorallia populi TaxID=2079200 RepID=UPI001E565A40|nr:lytic murein transglycosylase [Actinocorallia populi]
MRRNRLLTALSVVLVLALTAGAGWLAVRLGEEGGRPTARTPQSRITADMVVAEQVAPLERVVPPHVLAVAAAGVGDAQVERVRRIPRVRDVIVVDGGAVSLEGRRVNVFAVDPSRFRSWTAPATARNQDLWAALAADRFVAAAGTARELKLELGRPYQIVARSAPEVVLGGTAPLGVPQVDLLVSRRTGTALGLVSSVALMVNAPGAASADIAKKVRAVLGRKAVVVDLDTAAPQAGASYLDLYKKAATTCPGLSWTVLAAIGQVESDHGTNVGPSSAGALGPMQFMPATWRSYGVDGDGDGRADIMNPYDAIPAAARYLCASGAQRDLYKAVYAYNHADWYVRKVLSLADAYARRFS